MKLTLITTAIALSAATVCAQSNATDFQGFASRGIAMYNDANYLGCIDQMRHARQLAPAIETCADLEQVDYYLANALLYAGDASAQSTLEEFLAQYPASLLRQDVKFSLANIVFARRDYITALAMYKQIDINALTQARREEYYCNRGYSELKTGFYDEASQSYAQLLKSPEYSNAAKFYLAYIDYAHGNYNLAAQAFSEVNTATSPGNMADYYLCQIYYHDGEYNKAITKARELLRSPIPVEPMFTAEANRIVGECLYRLGSSSEAIPYIKKYLDVTLDPQPSALYIIGLSEYSTGKYEDAVDHLQEVVYGEPDAMVQSAYLFIGQSLSHLGDNDAAIVFFDKALNLDFDRDVQEVAYYNYAVTKFKGGTVPFGNSVSTFEQFLKRYPNSRYADQVRTYLVNGYTAEKNYDSALAAINKIQQPNAEILAAKQHVLYSLGARELSAGNPESALKYLDEAVTLAQYNANTAAEVQLLKGEALYNTGNYDGAAVALLTYLDKAPANAANRPLALYDLGYTRFRQKNYQDAATDFSRMIAKPGNLGNTIVADAYNRLADCYFYRHSFDKAAENYDKAIALEPSAADYALFQKGTICGYQRDYASKVKYLNQLISKYPSSALIPDAMLEITESYLRQNKTNDAIAVYRKLITEYPATPQARQGYLQMALTLLNNGNRAEAIEAYKDVVRLYPTSDEAAQAVENLKVISAEDNTMASLTNFLAQIDGAPKLSPSEAEMLVFEAAEKQYLTEDSSRNLQEYLKQYPNGNHVPRAMAYLMEEASESNPAKAYEYTCAIVDRFPDCQYAANALIIKAETETSRGEFDKALASWQKLERTASSAPLVAQARLGIVRTALEAKKYNNAIAAADAILSSSSAGGENHDELLFSRGLALYKTGNLARARADWQQIYHNTDNIFGAQSAYYLAQSLFDEDNLEEARRTVESLTSSGTPHTYWLARGFILLSDIYAAEGRDFEAKEYLKALRSNYPGSETEIFNMIDERLNK